MKSNILIIDADLENCKQTKYSLLAMADAEVYYTSSASEALLLSTAGGIEKLSTARQNGFLQWE